MCKNFLKDTHFMSSQVNLINGDALIQKVEELSDTYLSEVPYELIVTTNMDTRCPLYDIQLSITYSNGSGFSFDVYGLETLKKQTKNLIELESMLKSKTLGKTMYLSLKDDVINKERPLVVLHNFKALLDSKKENK